MSYIECPDCGKKIEVFGKSKLPEVAERYNLDILGQLPINPSLAEACDKGEVETALPDDMLPKPSPPLRPSPRTRQTRPK